MDVTVPGHAQDAVTPKTLSRQRFPAYGRVRLADGRIDLCSCGASSPACIVTLALRGWRGGGGAVRAPTANAYAERWVRTVRAECLDWLLIVNRRHLEQVLRIYVQHYNRHRPHRALGFAAPDPPAGLTVVGEDRQARVRRHDLLGGLLHEYQRAA
jgi:hypothetical protein